jgi:galactokinase
LAFAQALRSGNLSQLGTLLREGQRSLDEDFDVSSFELRAMVQAAEGLPGLIGIRQTGGGFGGACIAFVESADVEAFVPRLELSYQAATGIRPGILPTRPSGGASSDMPDF